jgi:ADP-dependent NAD(P)H-hydrate dehydratase / NAD(P)H-hydrate epimerase
VLVLAGGGGNGRAGVAAARRLAQDGVAVCVVACGRDGVDPADGALDVRAFDGSLPAAGVVLDALVGAGLRGALRGRAQAVVRALRHVSSPVVALDLPSGIDPRHGLVGDCVTADVTLALGALRPALLAPGMAPFVGELYLAPSAGAATGSTVGAGRRPLLVRVGNAEGAVDTPAGLLAPGWRE